MVTVTVIKWYRREPFDIWKHQYFFQLSQNMKLPGWAVFQILCPILLSHISSQYCQLYLVPSPVAVAVAEDNRRQDNSHHTEREDHLGYHFGTFWGPMEPLWVVEFHRLNWFWPGALIYTWLRQSLAKWTCHPAPAALLSHPLVWRQDTLGEASTTALADLVRVPGWRCKPYHLSCSCAAPSLSDLVEVSTWSTNFWVKHQPMRKLLSCKVLCAMSS